jgi:16S rRNA (guanine(1405)-N(7))-methyltransferase
MPAKPAAVDLETDLARLVQSVGASTKYRPICQELVERLGRQELAKRHTLREAIKATKNKLHQVGGAYLHDEARYTAWLAELQAAQNPADLRPICRKIMEAHASTRERLPILDEFYATVLAGLPPMRSVLDLACGLNPLALPWLPLAEGATYWALDIYEDMMAFVQSFMALPMAGVRGRAEARDVLQLGPTPRVDLALVLKAIPCLEQMDKAAGAKLLDVIQADHVLVSFPAHSLGHRDKGMVENYAAHFRQLLAGRPGQVRRFQFSSELVFLISAEKV